MAKRRRTAPEVPFYLAQILCEREMPLRVLIAKTGLDYLPALRLLRRDADPPWSLICKIADAFDEEPEDFINYLMGVHRETERMLGRDPWAASSG